MDQIVRLILVFCIVVLATMNTLYAWEVLPGEPSVEVVAMDSTEQTILVGMLGGSYWISDDGGITWQDINDRFHEDYVVTRMNDLNVIDADADTIIARSKFWPRPGVPSLVQQITVTTDGGDSWFFPRDVTWGGDSEFMICDYSNHDTFYYLSQQYVTRSNDFGTTWEEPWMADPYGNQSFEFIQDPNNPNTLYTVTAYMQSYNGGLLRSENSGTTWQRVLQGGRYYSDFSEIVVMRDIDVLSNGDKLITVPFDHLYASINSFLRSTDNGNTWQEEYPDMEPQYWPMKIHEYPGDPGNLLVRSRTSYPDQSRPMLESNDYGVTWSYLAEPWNERIKNAQYITSNPYNGNMYVCTRGNGAFKTVDQGESWEDIPLPSVSTVTHLIVSDSLVSWVPQWGGQVVRVQYPDQPETEFRYPNAPSDSFQISLPAIGGAENALTGLYLRRSKETNLGWLYSARSMDGGLSWLPPHTALPVGERLSERAVQYGIHNGHPYVIVSSSTEEEEGEWQVHITQDHGNTWSTFTLPNNINQAIKSSYYLKGNYLYAVHYAQGIYRTLLSNTEWEDMEHPAASFLKGTEATIIQDDIDAIYTYQGIYGYRYENDEWVQLGVLPYSDIWTAAALTSEQTEPTILAASWRTSSVYCSYDGGEEWTATPEPLPHHNQMIRIDRITTAQGQQRVYVNTPLGLMWEDASVFTAVDEDEHAVLPTGHRLLNVYPNPFNGQATATVTLDRSETVTLSLFNLLGQEVEVLVDGERRLAGEHAFSLDASRLASGSYFLRLSTVSGKAATRKIDLVR